MSLFKRPSELKVTTTIKVLVYGQPGSGKAQPLYCNILTPNGFKKLSDISVGDEVMGLDGKVQKILGVYPQGMRPVYRVITNDGAETYCDEEHLWTVRMSTGNSRKAGFRTLTLKEMLSKGISCPLSPSREISGRKPIPRFEIPMAAAINYPEMAYEIDPYILGVLIGDGALTGNVTLFSNPDSDDTIMERVAALLPEGYGLKKNVSPNCPQYSIVLQGAEEGYIQRVKRLGINVHSGDKFIPEEYKRGSHKQRLDLLRGLMDTDGTSSKNRTSFSTTSRRLAYDIVDLVRSLGGIAVVHYYEREGKSSEYNVNVNINECPFYLKRKAKEWSEHIVSRYIVSVERVEDSECVCVKVSNEDELYITDDYIVTHNTSLALSAPSPVLLDFDGGVQRVNGAFQCPTLQVESWDEVIEAMKEDLSEFQTIVIDTAGKMLDYMSAFIIKNDQKMAMRDGSLSLKGYGVRKTMFINFLKQCSMLGKNLIFVAHEREDKDGETRIVRPEIGGSSAGDLIKELDLVGYMQMIGAERTISWSPTEKFYAKNTCNLEAMQKIPAIIDKEGNVTAQNNFLTKTFDDYHAYLKKQAGISAEYEALMDVVRENVDAIEDAETANQVTANVLGFQHIWDSKIRAGWLISEKCQKLGLKFNKITKKYEQAEARVTA